MSQTSLRMRVVPRYPARVSTTNGIAATRDGVDLVVKSDYGSLVQAPSVTNPDRTFFLAWDQDIDSYQAVSFTNLINNIQDAVIGPPLAAIDAVNPGADQVVYFTDVGEAASYTVSSFVRGISNAPDGPSFLADIGGVSSVQVGAIFADIATASAATIAAGNKVIRTEVYSSASTSNGGGAKYQRISFADLTGYSAQSYFRSQDRFMPDGTTDATNGGYWLLSEWKPSVSMLGAVSGDTAANLLSAFQAAIDYLPSGGGYIHVPEADFSNLDPSTLDVGNKAITWDCRGRTTSLPSNMKGVVLKNGVFSLPETSIQANRSVRVHNWHDVGDIIAVVGTRQYVFHVSGYLHDTGGSPAELEFIAYAYDLGTNQANVVDAIRGIKGRVHADAGQANLRGIYSFVERDVGGSHSGLLTGFLGTIYNNDVLGGSDVVAIRAAVENGGTANFEATGAKTGGANTPSFAYRIRTGSGQPILPLAAGYLSHGGGAGDMFQGVRDNIDLTAIFRVDNKGKLLAQSVYSGFVTVANGAVATITPPNTQGGFIRVDTEGADQLWAAAKIRASGTHLCRAAGTNGTLFDLSTTALTGATGTDTHATLSCNNGVIQIENRTGATRTFMYEFMAR